MPIARHLAVLLGTLLFTSPLAATMVDEHSYGYPLSNPFEATIVTTPPHLRPQLPGDGDIDQADHSLRLRPERQYELPENFWPVTRLRYRLARQSGAAPLIFIVAGTGAHYASSISEYLKKLFYAAGYHVVQLSSPSSYDFMAAASRFATPGLTAEDAEDLYAVMLAVRAQHPGLDVSAFHLTGYSLGALQAAFVSHLDETRRALNFRRVLLLNPPVNLYVSARNLDRLVQTRVAGIDSTTTFYELMLGKLTRYFQAKGHIDLGEAVLYDFQRSEQQLSDEQMAMLIGSVFRFAAADIAFTSDLINRRGLITPASYPIREGTSLTPFLKRALQCDFECYIRQQLIPLWRARHDGGSLNQLIEQISLYALEEYLRASDKVAVMHNADDLILGPGDLGFLRRTFGERLTLYPRGGHCGNLNYRVNSAHILEFFRD